MVCCHLSLDGAAAAGHLAQWGHCARHGRKRAAATSEPAYSEYIAYSRGELATVPLGSRADALAVLPGPAKPFVSGWVRSGLFRNG